MFELKHGDCLDVLRTMADNSIDAIVTDPPYGLSFMGKKWDYDVPDEAVWRECLRVLKPGGHLLAFAGTRTQHRMAVRIEDAGFEIRDMIAWVYGSGFPKSLDVSKAIDRQRDDTEQVYQVTAWIRSARDAAGKSNRDIDDAFGFAGMAGHWTSSKSQPAVPTLDQIPKLLDVLGLSLDDVPDDIRELIWTLNGNKGQPGAAWFEREVVGEKSSGLSGGTGATVGRFTDSRNARGLVDITAPATEAAKQWHGWGTALKPALEPITVARKPIVGTVANNVLTWGTGGINVDGCRVGTDGETITATRNIALGSSSSGVYGAANVPGVYQQKEGGRFPANLIHDGSDEVVGLFPNVNTGKGGGAGMGFSGGSTGPDPNRGFGDSGSAARFFYCAKASKRDRDEGCEGMDKIRTGAMTATADGSMLTGSGNERTTARANHHPTVKPTDLMRYLCRLVTPPNGTVLDPFMGSGSTGKAAILEGFRFIGIEREAEYLEIARARIDHVTKEPNLWQS
jgi:DNA modification methylase